ncbi:unnamed protein product [Rotaria sp. Silwood1]|nr:unnamed protein product [Rotaria sp. Silwood1]CAF4709908.1 unnamed protein product [Rotaria sp. Silwood1]
MNIKIYQVDAFTDQLFGGNPAAVCPLDKWLSDSLMQQIAVENNLAETAFYVPNSINDGYELRWFTPEYEIDLCGHATLATAHIIFTEMSPTNEEIKFETKEAGELTVTRHKENSLYTLNFPARPTTKADLPDGLLQALRSVKTPIGVYKARDYMLVYENESDVQQLSPDYTALAKINDVFGVIATAPGDEVDFVSRYFNPGASIPEDPVTGSTHCNLIPYWSERLHTSPEYRLDLHGADLHECDARALSLPTGWYISTHELQMGVRKQAENSSTHPLAIEGSCYFIAEKIGILSQDIHVRRFSKLIDSGRALLNMSVHFGCSQAHQNDEAIMYLGYLDERYQPILVEQPVIRTNNKPFQFKSRVASIPIGTRTIKVYIGASIPNSTTTDILQYCVFDAVKLFIFDNNSNP